MKLKVFCHFDSNSFQNAQNLLFQRLQALKSKLKRLQALKKQILSVLKKKAYSNRFESYSNQSDKRL